MGAKLFKGKYEAKLEFPEGWGWGVKPKTSLWEDCEINTVNSRYCGHCLDCDLVSVLVRVRNRGVQEKKT